MVNKSKVVWALLLCPASVLAAAAAGPAGNGAIATVNGVQVPQSRLELLVKNGAAHGQPDTPEVRQRLRDALITSEVIAQEAIKKGLDRESEVASQIDMRRQEVLVNAYVQDYLKKQAIGEASLREEYERHKGQLGDREYKARHILVKEEAEARQIIAQLKGGADFAKIAAEKSVDFGSKSQGGDLDWSLAGRYVPEFANALRRLKKGDLTDAPVRTRFGWHVIRLDDERAAKTPTFEQLKPQLLQKLQREAVDKMIGELRGKAKIEKP